ncbi:MAG: GNAT family N-acetyltransferase [Chloroflexota bacterium]
MSENVKIVTVDAGNIDEQGFFCYKSKPKSAGYGQKLAWLKDRLAEGMRLKIVYEGKRSVGFIEYLPGEFAWRAVHAPGYQLVHCIWIVGKAKGQGYGQRLLDECLADARQSGAHGVAAVTTSRVWLAHDKLFLKAGFEVVDQAPPSFELLVQRFDDAPLPTFPQDWQERAARCGPGLTVFRSDQCPYIEDATREVVELGRQYGIEARVVRLTSAQQVQTAAPTAYGVFQIVYDGELVSYHYLGPREKERLVGLLARQAS